MKPDWVEHGAYRLEEKFTCFCLLCEVEAHRNEFDWEGMQHDVLTAWNALHALKEAEIQSFHKSTKSQSTLDTSTLPTGARVHFLSGVRPGDMFYHCLLMPIP